MFIHFRRAGELEARLAALGGWHGDTSGIRRDYRIGYDDAKLRTWHSVSA
jgi:hypothetical protein